MARFNDIAKLVTVRVDFNEVGAAREVREERQVFANAFSTSTDAALAARAQGLRLAAVLQVRTCDYHGEQLCEYGGELLDVEGASASGELTKLTLAKRLSDDQ